MRMFTNRFVMFACLLVSIVLAGTLAQAETFYFHNDQLGTPQTVTDNTQQVVWKGEYDPFGKVTETVALVEQNIRFPGQYFDQETTLHYNYFRTYDPSSGRYVESDQLGLYAGLSTFSYVYGNPLSNIDPDGQFIRRFLTGRYGFYRFIKEPGSVIRDIRGRGADRPSSIPWPIQDVPPIPVPNNADEGSNVIPGPWPGSTNPDWPSTGISAVDDVPGSCPVGGDYDNDDDECFQQ